MEKNIPGFVCVMTTEAPITSVKKYYDLTHMKKRLIL